KRQRTDKLCGSALSSIGRGHIGPTAALQGSKWRSHRTLRKAWASPPTGNILPEARAFEKLEQFQLDLVIGGLATDNPRGKRVGMTRAYLEHGDRKKDQRVLETSLGENRLISSFEKFLKRQAAYIHERYAEELQK